jgi:hypothetical protein
MASVPRLKYVSRTSSRLADGRTVDRYYYRRPGQPAVSLGSNPVEILELWRTLQAQYAANTKTRARRPGTIGELIQRFYASAEWEILSQSTKDLWRISFRTLEDYFGDFPPGSLSREVANKLKEKLLADGRGPSGTRNRILAYRRLWNWAIDQVGILDGANPWQKPGAFGKSANPRDGRIWEEADINAFLNARRSVNLGGNPKLARARMLEERRVPPGMRMALLLGLATTQRASDVLALTGANLSVNQNRLWMTLRQGKTKKSVSFPLVKIAAQEIKRQGIKPGDATPLVRSLNGEPFADARAFRKRFKVWTEAAGLKHTFKDLRSSGMVWMAREGATAAQIASVSGHMIDSSQRILDRYIPRNAAAADAAIRSVDDKITKAVAASAPRGGREATGRRRKKR